MQRLVAIITRPVGGLNRSLVENTAITIGRLGYVAPDLIAPILGSFIAPWCSSLRSIRDDIEKEHACLGLCQMIKLNPRAPLNAMVPMCDALASWAAPSEELNGVFRAILLGYKGSIPPNQWTAFYATFPPDLRRRLTERYGL